uniref:Peptidyl-prolyl cis-trans isomerase n=1 Tax=Sus scrofa TaxID=9823 RepID=A0A5G2R048_PIG
MAVANSSPVNPVVFFDVSIGGQEVGRMKIELFADVVDVPHSQVADTSLLSAQGDGTGVASIYRGPFADENFKLRHSAPGLLSMANSGPSTNGCQFFITCSKCDWLDGKHVVFGESESCPGPDPLHQGGNVPTGPNNKPKLPVVISQCGEM